MEDDWTTTLLSRSSGSILFIYIYILIPAEPGNSWTLPCGLRDSGQWSRVAIPERTAIKRFHQQEKSRVASLLLEPLTCDKKILLLQQHPRQPALCNISFVNSRKLICKLFPSEIENTVY